MKPNNVEVKMSLLEKHRATFWSGVRRARVKRTTIAPRISYQYVTLVPMLRALNYTQAQYRTQLSDLECATIVPRIPKPWS